MEIGRLVAAFEADTSKFEAGLRRVDVGQKHAETQAKRTGKALDDSFKAPSKSLSDLGQQLNSVLGRGPLGGFSSSLSGLSSSLTDLDGGLLATGSSIAGLAGPIGIGIAGLSSLAAAAGATAKGIYDLTTSSAEATGKFKDLAQQSGFSVETLSALSNIAEQTGGSIDTVNSSLGLFESNMVAAREKGSAMNTLFKELKISTTDNERALRQAIQALSNLRSEEDKVAVARKLFGRSGREMLAITKEMPGTLDETIKSMLDTTLVTTRMAERGDDLSDSVRRMHQTFSHAQHVIAGEFAPDVTRAVQGVTSLMMDNKDAIRNFGEAFALAARDVYTMVAALRAVAANISISGVPVLPVVSALLNRQQPAVPDLTSAFLPRSQQLKVMHGKSPFDLSLSQPEISDRGGRGGSGRGGGGGSARQDPGVQLLKQLEEEFKNLVPRTEAVKTADKLLETQYGRTLDSVKKRIMITAIEIDQMKAAQTDFEKMADVVRALGAAGEQGFVRARIAADSFFTSDLSKTIVPFQEQMEKLGETIQNLGEKGERGFTRLKHAADVFLNTRKRLVGIAPEGDRDSISLGGGSFAKRDPFKGIDELLTSTRPRFATSDQQVLHEQLEKIKDEMKGLGHELTDIFSSSMRVGIEHGGAQGLASFGLQLAEIVERNFLTKIANGLGDLLGTAATGGGFWGGLLKAAGFGALKGLTGGILGGVGLPGEGGLGSSLAGAISRDSGGPLVPNQLYKVHKDEYIVPRSPGFVIPKGGMGQQQVVHNHYNTFTLPDNKGFYSSPRSARQQAEAIASILASRLS